MVTRPAMRFSYDQKTRKAIDKRTGIEIFEGGTRPEIDEWPFTFYDPRVIAGWSHLGVGKYLIVAKPINRVERVQKADGSFHTYIHLDGLEINRKALWHSFSVYTGGDEQKFQKTCEVIQLGLTAWLRRDDNSKDPKVFII
jgi:hypothetical protein